MCPGLNALHQKHLQLLLRDQEKGTPARVQAVHHLVRQCLPVMPQFPAVTASYAHASMIFGVSVLPGHLHSFWIASFSHHLSGKLRLLFEVPCLLTVRASVLCLLCVDFFLICMNCSSCTTCKSLMDILCLHSISNVSACSSCSSAFPCCSHSSLESSMRWSLNGLMVESLCHAALIWARSLVDSKNSPRNLLKFSFPIWKVCSEAKAWLTAPM